LILAIKPLLFLYIVVSWLSSFSLVFRCFLFSSE
jgi:hypothetical protein